MNLETEVFTVWLVYYATLLNAESEFYIVDHIENGKSQLALIEVESGKYSDL